MAPRTKTQERTRGPLASTSVLERSLVDFRGELTVADAAARGGLALRDAERGLHELVARYRGHLAATEKGDLIFRFPQGLVSREAESRTRRALKRVGRAIRGVGRFLVRAWVSVVMVGYAAVFALVLLALLLRSDDNDDRGGDLVGVIFRGLFEALYWTFHPFSPVMVLDEPGWVRGHVRSRERPRVPFYERVNRFVFGPPPAPEPDEAVQRQAVMREIRAQRGRVGLGDVMRATGLPRERAEALVSQLLVDAEGEVQVTDEGAILYSFPELRRTTEAVLAPAEPAPAWQQRQVLAPLTGNSPESNFLFAGINAFNLFSSAYVIANGLTLERISDLVTVVLSRHGGEAPVLLPPPEGTPLVLGWIPFVFSTALFALPLVRALRRGGKRRAVERENGRRAVMAKVLTERPARDIPARVLREAWRGGAGREPTDAELRDAVRAVGGELEVLTEGEAAGGLVFRFTELATERQALARVRAEARSDEAEVGAVVFSSDRD